MADRIDKNVLLVEDETLSDAIEIGELKACGYSVCRVPPVEAAVEKALHESFDLLLIDTNPGSCMDGYELALRIIGRKDIPIIFLLSSAEPEHLERIGALDSYGFVLKGMGIPVLDTSIRTALRLFSQKSAEHQNLKVQLDKKERELKTVRSIAHVGNWHLNIDTGEIDWTEEISLMFGLDPSCPPPLFSDMERRFTPRSWRALTEAISSISRKDFPYELELEIIRPDGSRGWIWAWGEAVPSDTGGIFHLRGAAQDVTEKKMIEVAEREKAGRLNAIADNISNTIILSDRDGRIKYINHPHPSIPMDHILSSTVYDFVPEEIHPEIRNAFEAVFGRGEIYKYETPGPARNGEIGIFSVTVSPVSDGIETVSAVFLAEDITELKQDEIKIRQQLEEKEIILREAHHRIKNNILNIETLLALQVESDIDSSAKAVLQDTLGRVAGMRHLYDKMLLSDRFQIVSAREYLEDLIPAIFGLFPEERNIRFELDIAEIDIDVKRLFLLGIIVNELITNSVKYAFPENNAGEIQITLKKENGMVKFFYRDNGRGLPPDFDISKSSGFGLQLTEMLVQQLEGELKLENDKGMKCTVEATLG